MKYTIEYKHRGDGHVHNTGAESATAAVRLCGDLEASDAEIVTIRLDDREIYLGELKNEAGKEAANASRT